MFFPAKLLEAIQSKNLRENLPQSTFWARFLSKKLLENISLTGVLVEAVCKNKIKTLIIRLVLIFFPICWSN